jgi:hypothetical protein
MLVLVNEFFLKKKKVKLIVGRDVNFFRECLLTCGSSSSPVNQMICIFCKFGDKYAADMVQITDMLAQC